MSPERGKQKISQEDTLGFEGGGNGFLGGSEEYPLVFNTEALEDGGCGWRGLAMGGVGGGEVMGNRVTRGL